MAKRAQRRGERRWVNRLVALGLALGVLLCCRRASAGPRRFTLGRVGAMVIMGGGDASTPNDSGGFGGQLGYTFPFGLFAGGFYFHRMPTTACALWCTESRAWEWGGRFGWDFNVKQIALRPFLSAGAIGEQRRSARCTPSLSCDVDSRFAWGGGAQLLFGLVTPHLFIVGGWRLLRDSQEPDHGNPELWELGLGGQL